MPLTGEDSKNLALLANELAPHAHEIADSAMRHKNDLIEDNQPAVDMGAYTRVIVEDFFKAAKKRKLDAFVEHVAKEAPMIYKKTSFDRVNTWFYFVRVEICMQASRLTEAGKLPRRMRYSVEKVFHNIRTVLFFKYLEFEMLRKQRF